MHTIKFHSLCFAAAALLISGVHAAPFELTPDTAEITGVLTYALHGPADNYDVITDAGGSDEVTVRLHFEGPLDEELLQLVLKMDQRAVEPEDEGTTTYPDVSRTKVTGRVETDPDSGLRFLVEDVGVATPTTESTAQAADLEYQEALKDFQNALALESQDPKAIAAQKYLEEAGLGDRFRKLAASFATRFF